MQDVQQEVNCYKCSLLKNILLYPLSVRLKMTAD